MGLQRVKYLGVSKLKVQLTILIQSTQAIFEESARFSDPFLICEQSISNISLLFHRLNEALRFLDDLAYESHTTFGTELATKYAHC